jgi:hypothetical protein
MLHRPWVDAVGDYDSGDIYDAERDLEDMVVRRQYHYGT